MVATNPMSVAQHALSSPRSSNSTPRTSMDSNYDSPLSTGYSQLLQMEQDERSGSESREIGPNSVPLTSANSFGAISGRDTSSSLSNSNSSPRSNGTPTFGSFLQGVPSAHLPKASTKHVFSAQSAVALLNSSDNERLSHIDETDVHDAENLPNSKTKPLNNIADGLKEDSDKLTDFEAKSNSHPSTSLLETDAAPSQSKIPAALKNHNSEISTPRINFPPVVAASSVTPSQQSPGNPSHTQNSPKRLAVVTANNEQDSKMSDSDTPSPVHPEHTVYQYYKDNASHESLANAKPSKNKSGSTVTYHDDATDAGFSDSDDENSPNSSDRRRLLASSSDGDLLVSSLQQGRIHRSRSVVSFSALNGTVDRFVRDIRDKFQKYTQGRHNRLTVGLPRPNEIYYTVFKTPLYTSPTFSLSIADLQNGRDGYSASDATTQQQFDAIVDDAIEAIEDLHIQPKMISQGSSGSYFVYNTAGRVVGVFKPKDEEPYGPLSPKWTKWIHRNLFPCFFGRSCLIPNNGYIAECAASLLDRQLGTNIVPFTDIVHFSSPSFYYRFFDRRSFRLKGKRLPNKVGSFQLFLHDYVQADQFLRDHPFTNVYQRPLLRTLSGRGGIPPPAKRTEDGTPQFEWTPQVIAQFREEIEKLVILDYIMRNTDRGLDNWMIKLEWYEIDDYSSPEGSNSTNSTTDPEGSNQTDDINSGSSSTPSPTTPLSPKKKRKVVPHLRIGAIDSGLAFPWKHPDEWRSYPFGWLFLPMILIGQPFSTRTREHFLSLLSSSEWWEESALLFRQLFSQDTEFSERMFKRQWAVLKGQAFNVVETLKDPEQGPLELVRRTRVMVWDDEMDVPVRVPYDNMSLAMDTPLWAINNNNNNNNNTNRASSVAYPEMAPPSLDLHKPRRATITADLPLGKSASDGLNNPFLSPDVQPLPFPSSQSVPVSAGPEGSRVKGRRNRGSSLTLEARYRTLERDGDLASRKSFDIGGQQEGTAEGEASKPHHERPLFEDLIRVSPPPSSAAVSSTAPRMDLIRAAGGGGGSSSSGSSDNTHHHLDNSPRPNKKSDRYHDNIEEEGEDEVGGSNAATAGTATTTARFEPYTDDPETHARHGDNSTNNMGFSVAEEYTEATKKVIVERLQTVTSKPPVFTWC